ncbi:hypothetical protein J7J60_01295 [bacterium]|nr:hypothetical protein [bacterium]
MFYRFYRLFFCLIIIGFLIWLICQNFSPSSKAVVWQPSGEDKQVIETTNFTSHFIQKKHILGLYPSSRWTILNEGDSYLAEVWMEPIYFFVPLIKDSKKAKVILTYQSNLPVSLGLMHKKLFPLDWRFKLESLKDEDEKNGWKTGSADFFISQDFINKKDRFKGLEFIISCPNLYQQGEYIKIKEIQVILE